ncbi:MAG: glycosyltransferase family 4 protein [Planctomycetes bacterium]|nr:glycosyltransferase family 4 protein [Planctomycetota bacterium]
MRILYVTSAELGRPYAPASRAKGLSAALARRGIDVHLLATSPASGFSLPNGRVGHLRKPAVPKLGAVVWHADLCLRLADLCSARFDAVLLRETPRTIEPALFALLRRIPFVLEVNGIAPEGRAGFARACYDWNYRSAARIVVLTEALGSHLAAEFDVDPARIRVIPNAADTVRFSPRPRAEARGRLGLPQDAFVVVYMGSYHEQQGVDCVIPLCGLVPDVLFVMTGDGTALRRKVEEAGLEARFRFVGALPDDRLADAVSAADVALSPIRPEEAWRTEATFPQKIVEYLACGTPVLAVGRSEAQVRILRDCGALVPPDDGYVGRLAALLGEWSRDPRLVAAMGARGAATVRERYGYEAIAAEFEDLFRSL